MGRLTILDEDGPLGEAGDQVWVNDKDEVDEKPTKKPARAKKSTK